MKKEVMELKVSIKNEAGEKAEKNLGVFDYESPESLEEALMVDAEDYVLGCYLRARKQDWRAKKLRELMPENPESAEKRKKNALVKQLKAMSLEDLMAMAMEKGISL